MNIAIIVAGGKGLRMQHTTRKQYLPLAGLPILSHTLRIFDLCRSIDVIYLVTPPNDQAFCREHILAASKIRTLTEVVPGGEERQASVWNGLMQARKTRGSIPKVAVVHDGVRPLVTTAQIESCIAEARQTGACILGIPAADTLKRVDANGNIVRTIDRKAVWQAQTPQAFGFDLLLTAYEKAHRDGYQVTDDAALVERLGKPVKIIAGSHANIKITTPEDLALAEIILKQMNSLHSSF